MKCYLAKFALPDSYGGFSYSAIWAESKARAAKIAAERGMGPVSAAGPQKEFRPSVLATLPGGWARPDVLHSICYLGFLAGRHGLVSAEQLVGDDGPLHELAHFLSMGEKVRHGKMRQHLEARVAWLESIVPGMPPPGISLKLPDIVGVCVP